MPQLAEELSVLEAQQTDAEDTLASYQQQDLTATEQKSQLDAQASVLDGERTKLEHYDARFDAQEWLKSNAWTLDSLRQSYEIAAGTGGSLREVKKFHCRGSKVALQLTSPDTPCRHWRR